MNTHRVPIILLVVVSVLGLAGSDYGSETRSATPTQLHKSPVFHALVLPDADQKAQGLLVVGQEKAVTVSTLSLQADSPKPPGY